MMISGKKYLSSLFLVLMLISAATFAQEPVKVTRSDNKVVLEGKVYYVHVVKPGQTLYSIARAYNVTEKEVIIENPGASSDLLVGQVLKIPSDPASAFSVDTGKTEEDLRKHILKAGETIYAISRIYEIPVDEIMQYNPGLDINDIPIGQEILLPPEEPEQNQLAFDEEGMLFHKVKKGETLYSIARYYGVSVREIRTVNPELGWGGPRSGDVLRIPQPNTTVSEVFTPDSIMVDTVMPELDSSEMEVPYTYEELQMEEYMPGKMYRIVYLVPFNYSEMEPLDSLLRNVKSAPRRDRIKKDYMLEKQTPKSIPFLEFLEGALLAADALAKTGMELDIHVFDTKQSMYTTRQILEKPEMRNADLIIGPFYSYNLELVSDFSRKHRIPLVTPFHTGDSLLMDNPYLFQPNPSYRVEFKRNAEFIARSYEDNLVMVHDGDSASMERIEYYKQQLFDELEKYSALETVLFKEVIVRNGATEDLVHALNPDKKNVIILPTFDEAFASQVTSRIYYEVKNYDIALFGSTYWLGFNNIEIPYIHALNLRISHTHYYDYTDPEYLHFLREYRQNYFKEPGSFTRNGCNFGVTGYDLSLYFISALQRFGPKFILHLGEHHPVATICDFNFQRISRRGGYENVAMQYYYFDDDLRVVEIDIPEQPPMHRYRRPAGVDPLYFRWLRSEPDSTFSKQ
ncbi:MAG: LysM peptidoglycan-binding domain-containing protein [Bacteroidales bacterium]|nr:LysM peptidoglycan-binding domain-containing protein [Bacteroidales bacterium]MDT8430513.1 LysM peptidoglycan-binding domain-containing protein [Bacteroidales bacterium]